jgi:hypothetical protein
MKSTRSADTAQRGRESHVDLDARHGQNIHGRGHLNKAASYRVHGRAATAFMVMCWVVCGVCACKTSTPNPDEEAPPQISQDEEAAQERAKSQRTEDVLFDAIIDESTSRGFELKTISPKFHTVITGYEQVSARLRKRRIMKIIILPRGGALNVNVSYERDAGVQGTPDWQVLEDEGTRTRAAQEELELARAIEQRLHKMKRQRARQR